jgi:hypothetical protein
MTAEGTVGAPTCLVASLLSQCLPFKKLRESCWYTFWFSLTLLAEESCIWLVKNSKGLFESSTHFEFVPIPGG